MNLLALDYLHEDSISTLRSGLRNFLLIYMKWCLYKFDDLFTLAEKLIITVVIESQCATYFVRELIGIFSKDLDSPNTNAYL